MRRRGWTVAVMIGSVLASAGALFSGDTKFDLSGRVSPQIAVTTYPENSAFRDVFGSSSVDSAFDARVIFGAQRDRWSFDADYQLVGLYADRLEFTRELPDELQVLFPHLPDDRTPGAG